MTDTVTTKAGKALVMACDLFESEARAKGVLDESDSIIFRAIRRDVPRIEREAVVDYLASAEFVEQLARVQMPSLAHHGNCKTQTGGKCDCWFTKEWARQLEYAKYNAAAITRALTGDSNERT